MHRLRGRWYFPVWLLQDLGLLHPLRLFGRLQGICVEYLNNYLNFASIVWYSSSVTWSPFGAHRSASGLFWATPVRFIAMLGEMMSLLVIFQRVPCEVSSMKNFKNHSFSTIFMTLRISICADSLYYARSVMRRQRPWSKSFALPGSGAGNPPILKEATLTPTLYLALNH